MASAGRFDPSQVVRHLLFAIAIGVVCAFSIVILSIFIDFMFSLSTGFEWLIFLLPVFSLISLALYRHWHIPFNTTIASQVTSVRRDEKIPFTQASGMFFGTALSTLGGASVGHTAAALYIGAAFGDSLARLFHLKTARYKESELQEEKHGTLFDEYVSDLMPIVDDDTASMLQADAPSSIEKEEPTVAVRDRGIHGLAASCGMAAAFSALFFAPLAGVMFVLELLAFKRSVGRYTVTLLIASFVAFFISQGIHIGSILPHPEMPEISWMLVGDCIVVGLVCAFVGSIFVALLNMVSHRTLKTSSNYVIWLLIGSGLTIVLLLIFGWDDYRGNGIGLIENALIGDVSPWGFAVKALLTIAALGFWLKGGEVMPSFTIGAMLGSSCSYLTGGDPAYLTTIGMIAFFAAVTRCPVTAVVLGCEMFGWNGFLLYAIAVFVTNLLGHDIGLYGRGTKTAVRKVVRATRMWRTSQNASDND